MKPVLSMKGIGELLEVFEEKLEITPKGVMGFLAKGIKGTKTIPFYAINGIQFKRSGMTSGYLQFTIPGGNESKGGVFAAATDENTFMFAGQNDQAQKIKEYIEERIRIIRTPPQIHSSEAKGSIADELKKLADLREAGILSEEEFQSAKLRLLA